MTTDTIKTDDQGCHWVRRCFKKNKVWAETGPDGSYMTEKNRIRIKYNLKQTHEYRVYPKDLEPEHAAVPATSRIKKKGTASGKKTDPANTANPSGTAGSELLDNAIVIYTDGASSGNPGPSGIGILMQYQEHEKKVSRYIGNATNNIAELEAIRVALETVKNPALPIRLYTDSSYAIGLLTQNWKATQNQALVASIRKLMTQFPDLKLIKVKGHSGIPGNEAADQLATAAITNHLRNNRESHF